MKLAGKIAVITGGNSGTGLGIAQVFNEEGARGAIMGRNPETLEAAARKLGDDFLALRGDVTQLADLERMFQATADKFGKLDALIVNVGGAIGTGMSATVVDATEDFQRNIGLG